MVVRVLGPNGFRLVITDTNSPPLGPEEWTQLEELLEQIARSPEATEISRQQVMVGFRHMFLTFDDGSPVAAARTPFIYESAMVLRRWDGLV